MSVIGPASIPGSPDALAPAGAPRPRGRERPLTLVAGAMQLAALAAIMARGSLSFAAVALAAAGAVLALWVLAARLRALLSRHPELWLVLGVGVCAVLWFSLALTQIDRAWARPPLAAWPWSLGHLALLPLAGCLLAAGGALVLISDAVRVRAGFAPRRRVPWRDLTATAERPIDVGSRVVAGVVLTVVAAALAIGTAGPIAQNDPTLQLAALVIVGAGAAAILGVPVLIGSRLRLDRDKVMGEREQERRRLAAHLHDSVLQTLALVQRQAHDPAAVARLARRQEHALRAWMAGQAELSSGTLVAALREVVAGVEDDHGVEIELVAIGDRVLDPASEMLAAAAREALRNAARHARGARIFVFAEVTARGADVFVRDEGPGFDLDAVAPERRGIRDAIVGRMQSAGGHAVVDSAPGTGTEVALRIGPG
jgi:signal transduction histidine kinase